MQCEHCGGPIGHLKPSAIKRGGGRYCSASCRSKCARRTHGLYKSATYHSWQKMRGRCRNPQNARYADYGGRGIHVCDRWDAFANFLADMGERPEGLTLDRIDVNGDYTPENCRWATATMQQRNTRWARILIYRGERIQINDLADRFGLKRDTLRRRVASGWPEDMLGQPAARKKRFQVMPSKAR